MVRAGRDNAQLVERLRNFYRPCANRDERESVDLNALIKQAITLDPEYAPAYAALGTAIAGSARLSAQRVQGSRSLFHPPGAVAQLGERMTGSHEVRGSIPLGSTNSMNSLGPPLTWPFCYFVCL